VRSVKRTVEVVPEERLVAEEKTSGSGSSEVIPERVRGVPLHIFSKGDDTGEEGNSGGVTASCSLDEAELDRSRKRAILAGVQETSSLR
jgi:hypothetical protein